MLRTLLVSAFLAVLCIPVWGQALPAGGVGVWQVGAGFSVGPPDYTLPYIAGISAYASYDLDNHTGFLVEAHFMNLSTPQKIGESSYLAGARYGIMRYHFHIYLKGLIGIGRFTPKPGFLPPTASGTYEAFAAGFGLEHRITEHLNWQIGDFEFQGWPAFPKNGLTPWIVTSGISYRF